LSASGNQLLGIPKEDIKIKWDQSGTFVIKSGLNE
jgi:hypothetical protein